MFDDLYFVPIITKALEKPDTIQALVESFTRIKEMEHMPQYRQGYFQYHKFMEATLAASSHDPDDLHSLIETLCLSRNSSIGFMLSDTRKEERQFEQETGSRFAHIENIDPGFYAISLSSGRVLWEGALSESHLVWSEAFPDKSLQLAADTGGAEILPTFEEDLLDGEIMLRVYAGLESGRIELEMKDLNKLEP